MDFNIFEESNQEKFFKNLRVKHLTSSKKGNCLVTSISVSKVAFNKDSLDIITVSNPAPYDAFVYVIPQYKLLHHDCLSDGKGFAGKRELKFYPDGEISHSKTYNWIQEFLLRKPDPNFYNRLKAICDKQRNPDLTPIILDDHKFWDFECTMFHEVLQKWNSPYTFAKEDSLYKFDMLNQKVQEIKFRKGWNLFLAHGSEEIKYKINDFDFGYANLPGTNYFYFFPLSLFAKNGITPSKFIKISIDINNVGEEFKDYFFSYLDKNLYDKLKNVISKHSNQEVIGKENNKVLEEVKVDKSDKV